MSNTKFSHAGVSKLDGEFKVRFCNDALRQKVLIKNNHKDIDIVELKHPMTKEEAVAYLISINFADGNAAVQAALDAAAEKRGLVAKAPKAKAAKKAQTPEAVVETAPVAAASAALEDAAL